MRSFDYLGSRWLGNRSYHQPSIVMSLIRSFKDLRVWQEAAALATDVDALATSLPTDRAPLADQLRRAADSVHANIAEGHGRRSDRDFARYLVMSRGSLHEIEARMLVIRAEAWASMEEVTRVEVRIRRVEQLLTGLIDHLTPPASG